MLPFLEIEIGIANTEQKEKRVIARILPDQIEYYYPGFYNGTVIVMKSGNSCFISESVEEFDAILLEYNRTVKSNTGKFGNLSLNSKSKLHATN